MRTLTDQKKFIFSTDVETDRRSAVVVLWSAFPMDSLSDYLPDLASFLEARPEATEAWFVAPRDAITTMLELRSDEYHSRTSELAGLTFRFIAVDGDGTWCEEESALQPGDGEPIAINARVVKQVHEDGMRQAFRDSNSLVAASAGFHFERPGRGHSEYFIRSSQAVARAQHAFFVAAALLPLFSLRSGTRMYGDTAGILPFLHAFKELTTRLNGDLTNVVVDTFGGYDGIVDNLRDVQANDLIVISGSTSGSLAEAIKNYGVSSDAIFTLYYLSLTSPSPETGRVLCDLSNRDEVAVPSVRDARHVPFPSYSSAGGSVCELCAEGSRPIVLAGDEFFPEPAGLSLRMLTLTDRPLNRKRERQQGQSVRSFDGQEYFEDFFGTGVITARSVSSVGAGDGVHRQGISTRIDRIFAAEAPHGDLIEKVAAAFSRLRTGEANITTVVSLPDQDSRAVAAYVANQLWPKTRTEFEGIWGPARDQVPERRSEIFDSLSKGSTVLVCAGVLASGRALLGLSRELRTLPSGVDVSYLVLVMHPESETAREVFERTLRVRSAQDRSSYEVVWTLPREAGTPGVGNPWDRERLVLGEVEEWLAEAESGSPTHSAVTARLEVLTSLSDEYLFADPRFSATSPTVMAAINAKFALWPFEWSKHSRAVDDGLKPSQPEVFATVAHLMYSSRRTAISLDKHMFAVRRHGYVINPAVFDRFNDPQIQSAIIRGSEAGELDYHSDPDASRAALDVLKYSLINIKSEAGAASYEMLLALGIGQLIKGGHGMRLAKHDLVLLTKLCDTLDLPPLVEALARFLGHLHASSER